MMYEITNGYGCLDFKVLFLISKKKYVICSCKLLSFVLNEPANDSEITRIYAKSRFVDFIYNLDIFGSVAIKCSS